MKRSERGFTLIEVIVILAIIGIVVALSLLLLREAGTDTQSAESSQIPAANVFAAGPLQRGELHGSALLPQTAGVMSFIMLKNHKNTIIRFTDNA